MHHQDFAGESAGAGGRKTTHPSGFHHRRGSGGTSAAPSSAAAAAAAAAGGGGGGITCDDIGPQAGSSSPGLHHHQLQSQAAGAQVKKKSGFQITSVTSAQVNVSANNSLADDTESYDDMDESHTEDLSSSDMLDVSVSRATDTGVPERSSSDETLNSLHGVDTPALASPNEPLQPQGSQASMVNGTLHHHHHHQLPSNVPHHHGHQLDRSEGATASVATSANPSPAIVPNAAGGPGQHQRIAVLNATGTIAGTTALPPAVVVGAETRTQTQMVNTGPVSCTAGGAASGPTGYDSSAVGAHGASIAGGTIPVVQAQSAAANGQTQALHGQTQNQGPTQIQQTQAPTGSRFRVVKLDTNSEPFRKGRWTCTEYYEKEIPHATTSEMPKASEAAAVAAETEVGNPGVGVIGQGPMGPQPPQTLQPHQQGAQDFTSPQAMHSPPQPMGLNPLQAQMPLQDLSGGTSLLQQSMIAPSTAGPQVAGQGTLNPPAQVMHHQVPSQMGYPATQLPAGVGGRQPDFIQPTAPFQTQVQPPPSHVISGVTMVMGHGGGTQAPVGLTQQLPHQGQGNPAAVFTQGQLQRLPAQQPQQQQHHPPNPQGHALAPSTHGTTYVPLTALQADLQPLLTSGANFAQTSVLGAPVLGGGATLRTTHLEDAQRLLFQHRLEQQAAGTLAHMGMAAEASALMAAAAGLRGHPAEGDEDR
ncbi:TSC22 domain family protein 1 [Merluccius polli]|uniref:TSC22 domain family protein 1 n=1 Tax=Merluccius polli TaxID=89951 RepID=A0AA47ML90_MERPO|nr:TSC22 domain family protein 1 [Merluccius polli]